MQVRSPDLQLDQGELVWSKIPEFAMAYNGFSVVIPHVEYYLNNIMGQVRKDYCSDKPKLKADLNTFIKQETFHSRFHNRFNQRMYDAGYQGLKPLVDKMADELKTLREQRSLAFNAAYCAGFECIATFDAKYLYEQCDEFFDGAEPQGANLLLWHVAEEFEHRAVCHDALHAVSSNYFTRIHGLLYAFWHIGGTFMQAEQLILQHHWNSMDEQQIAQSKQRSSRLFWRQLRYVAPRMLKILLPGYNPSKLKTPTRITRALEFFSAENPITQRVKLAISQ